MIKVQVLYFDQIIKRPKMKSYMIVLFMLIGPVFAVRSQAENTDRIFLTNGEIHSVIIKQVAPETITYYFAGEEIENVVEKTDVEKIILKSGREQNFASVVTTGNFGRSAKFEYPTMKSSEGAILPFEFVFDGLPSEEDGFEAQEFYYDNLMRRPERNTITYQDVEVTRRRLRDAGIKVAADIRDFDMDEIARIVGAGILVTGKITVDYRSTTSTNTGSTTTRVDTKKKKVKTYSSDYSSSSDEFDTKVDFRIYDKNGDKIIDETRRPFLATTRNNYITALNYLMKRTPYYQK